MNCTLVLLAAAFGFLTPQDAQKLKVAEANDPRHDFQNLGMDSEAIAVRRLPMGNLRHTWRELGVKIYQHVDWDDEGSAQFYRRQLGFKPFMGKADGVLLDRPEAKLPAHAKAALAAAKDDVKLLERLVELAEKAAKSANHKIRIEHRRVLHFLSDTDTSKENVDTLRLDTLELIRRLEFLLGEKDGGYDKYYELPKLGTRPEAFKPYADVTPMPEGVKPKMNGERVQLADGFFFSVNPEKYSFGFTVENPQGKLVRGRVGDDFNEFTMKLTIPGPEKGSWNSYKYRFRSLPLPMTPLAPQEGSYFMAVQIDDRFEHEVPVVATVPNQDWSRTYPKLVAAGKLAKGAKGGWQLSMDFNMMPMFDNFPMTRDGIVDVWYVEIDKLPGVAGPVLRRISFPKGDKRIREKTYFANFNTGAFTRLYLGPYNEANDLVSRAWSERHYGFLESPTFHLFSRQSDCVFERDVVGLLKGDVANLCEALWDDKNHPHPKIKKMNEAKRNAALAQAGKLVHYFEDVSEARRDYVLMRRRGEMPEVAKPKPKKAVEKLSAPDMDAEASDDITLEDDKF